MAIDTSAFDKYKKNNTESRGVTGIDVSAFGYSWGTEESPDAPAQPVEQPRFLGGATISSPSSVKVDTPVSSRFIEALRKYLPETISSGLVGTGYKYGAVKEDTGLLQFLLPGFTKSNQKKLDDRIEKLTTPRRIGDVKFPGFTQERAAEIAWSDITGKKNELITPLEQKILNSVGRWEAADTFLDTLNFVPVFGAALKRGFQTQLSRIAKLTDNVLIGKELNKILPNLDEVAKAALIPKLVKAKTSDDVAKLIGEATKTAAVSSDAAPLLRDLAKGRTVTAGEAVAESAAKIATRAAAAETPSFVKRAAISVQGAKTSIAKTWKALADDPTRLNLAARALAANTLDEKIIALSKALKGNEDDVAKSLAEAIEAEKRVFLDSKGIKLPENAKGNIAKKADEQFIKYFQGRYGKTPAQAVKAANIKRAITSQKVGSGKAVLNANKVANQTPVSVSGTKKVVTNTDVHPAAKVADKDFDAGAVADLAKRDQTTLRPSRAIGRKVVKGRNLAKEIEANVLKYNDKLPDKDIAKMREQNLLGKETIDEIIARKRGIITDVESIERAKMIKGTLQDVIDLPKGTTATVEQRRAIEQIIQNERDIALRMKILMDNGGVSSTPAERKLLKDLGEKYENIPEHELLNRAYAETIYNLKKAEIVFYGIGSEIGRTLQSMRKVVEGVDSRLRILLNKINSSKKYDELEKQAMLEMIAKMNIDDPKEFLKALEKISTSDWFDKVAEWSVAAKLWNPTTHAVNFGGNALRQGSDILIKTTTNPMAAKADLMGAMVGFKRGMKNSLRALTDDGYAQSLSKYIEAGGTAPAIGGKLGKWVRTPFRMLGAGDEIFKNMAYQRKLHRDAYTIARKEGLKGKQLDARMEELLNTPTFEMMEGATNEAKRMTFQEDLGELMRNVDNIRNPSRYKNRAAKAGAVFTRFFVPFLKTPTNLFKQSIDFSPLGPIKSGILSPKGKFWKAVKANDHETVGTILGEAIIGTAIGTYIGMETLDGNVTGGAPRNPGEKDRFYRENKLPYAIKVGDMWYQYKRVDPFATIIGLTADMVTLEDKDIGSLFGVVAENLKDKTYLSGVSDLMKVLTGDDWERDYALKSMVLGAALPSFVGHTTRTLDPTIRVADTLGHRLLVQVPGMSESFPAKVNVLGYDVQRANKGLNYFFNPVQMETAEIDPVTKELLSIDKAIPIPEPSFTRTDKRTKVKTTYKFTDAEYEDYARFVGIKLRYDLVELFKSPRYQRADNEGKIALIDKLRSEIQTEYKDAYVAERREGAKLTDVQRARNIFQGKDPNAVEDEENDLHDSIRSYFINE